MARYFYNKKTGSTGIYTNFMPTKVVIKEVDGKKVREEVEYIPEGYEEITQEEYSAILAKRKEMRKNGKDNNA